MNLFWAPSCSLTSSHPVLQISLSFPLLISPYSALSPYKHIHMLVLRGGDTMKESLKHLFLQKMWTCCVDSLNNALHCMWLELWVFEASLILMEPHRSPSSPMWVTEGISLELSLLQQNGKFHLSPTECHYTENTAGHRSWLLECRENSSCFPPSHFHSWLLLPLLSKIEQCGMQPGLGEGGLALQPDKLSFESHIVWF